MDSDHLGSKKEPDEPLPEPQRRVPSPEHYRSIIGPGPHIVCRFPRNGNPYWDPIQRKPNEQSQYDERLWPPTLRQVDEQMKKHVCQETFLLNDDEMGDLPYIIGPRYGRYLRYQDHLYLAIEAERRAWEIYGGPDGYQFAKKMHDERVARRRQQHPRTSRRRSTSSQHDYHSPYTRRFDPVLALVGNICESCDCDY